MRNQALAVALAFLATAAHAFVVHMSAGPRQLGTLRPVAAGASLQRQRGLRLYSVEEQAGPEPAPEMESAAEPVEGGDEEAAAPKKKRKGEFVELSEEELEALPPMELEMYEKAKEAARLRAAEKFIVKSTGDYECRSCAYVYSTAQNVRSFEDLPSTWKCPVCRAPKDTFMEQTVTIAGFEANQGYGFGTNSMTGGQKNLLIFGGLGAFLALFLLGYALD